MGSRDSLSPALQGGQRAVLASPQVSGDLEGDRVWSPGTPGASQTVLRSPTEHDCPGETGLAKGHNMERSLLSSSDCWITRSHPRKGNQRAETGLSWGHRGHPGCLELTAACAGYPAPMVSPWLTHHTAPAGRSTVGSGRGSLQVR